MSTEELHCKFKCNTCAKNLELPLCCKMESIQMIDGKIYCELCGSKKEIPVCCNEETKFVGIL